MMPSPTKSPNGMDVSSSKVMTTNSSKRLAISLASLSLTGGGSSGCGGNGSASGRTHRWRVMVLGHQSCGKSAFVVRFLTRRFIADYAKHERCYTVNTHLKGENISLELLDSGGHHLEDGSQSELEAKIRWADAFVLMYSVTDKCSFDECCRLRFLIGYNKRRRRHLFSSSFGNGCGDSQTSSHHLILVGNKTDQVEDRMVTYEEGEKRSRDLGCDLFFEISVREEADAARRIVESLYSVYKQQHGGHQQQQSPPTPFGRRCLETFTGSFHRPSNSMDIINERSEDASILPIYLSLGSPMEHVAGQTSSLALPDKFRTRASTEGSLGLRSRIKRPLKKTDTTLQWTMAPAIVGQAAVTQNAKPMRRMSISLRGTNSVF